MDRVLNSLERYDSRKRQSRESFDNRRNLLKEFTGWNEKTILMSGLRSIARRCRNPLLKWEVDLTDGNRGGHLRLDDLLAERCPEITLGLQGVGHAAKYALPIAESGLAKQPHGGIPRTVLAAD